MKPIFRKPKVLFSGSLMLLSALANAQYYEHFQNEYFFGNQNCAKTEAMGYADVAIGGGVYSMYQNPAGISLIKNQEAYISRSRPYYLLTNARYTFAGFAKRINPKMVLAATFHQFNVGATHFVVDINGTDWDIDRPTTNNAAVTFAYQPIKNLHVGINVNYFYWKLFNNIPAGTVFQHDLGALYVLPLNKEKKQRLQFAASVTNITKVSLTYMDPNRRKAVSEFPEVFRAGLSWFSGHQIHLPKTEPISADINVTVQHQDVLNNNYLTQNSLGAECIFASAFCFRMGLRSLTVNDEGISTNLSKVNDLTIGMGLIIPLNEKTGGKIPGKLYIDYAALKQPPHNTSFRRLDNMHVLSLRFQWAEKQQAKTPEKKVQSKKTKTGKS
ncbi:MAG: hypothetical protein GC181_14090 [Bacteroidetes bacterium]|nr:hypothetical protein [Bacteroidota bacterium]